MLGPDEAAVGLSADLVAYVSIEYFTPRTDDGPCFEDYVVHEAAHVLHDAKRDRVGLRGTRNRERLVDLEFRMRETFAYACEAFRLVVEQARRPADRIALVEAHLQGPGPSDLDGDRRQPGAERGEVHAQRQSRGPHRAGGRRACLDRCRG